MPSYYEALPIYRAAMDCAVGVDAAVQRFPKGHKYTLGARLRNIAADIVLGVARAIRREGRAQALAALTDRIEDLKLLLTLAKEVKAFSSFNGYARVVNQVVGLARQAEAWRRSVVAKSGPEPARPSPKGAP
ncbi:MAG: four helix bundle protein [Minicystis sp.]